MFKKQKSLLLRASASMLTNNLAITLNSITNEADILFVHKSVAHLVLSGAESDDGYLHKNVVCKIPAANQQMSFIMILQADWVEVAGQKILVLATQKGIKMYDWDGSALLHWHGFGGSGEAVIFTRGICSIGSNTICIGTSSGQLMVFSVSAKASGISFEEYLSGHTHSITAVVSRGDILVSADEKGDIIVWKHMDGTSFKLSAQHPGTGSPCNCLGIWKNLIVAGFGSGLIRVYDLGTSCLVATIDAHARSVNAIHIAQGSGLCISVSEDTFVRVWQLMAGAVPEVNQVFCDRIVDCQLVGAQFTDNEGRSFAVTAYDSAEILMYQRA